MIYSFLPALPSHRPKQRIWYFSVPKYLSYGNRWNEPILRKEEDRCFLCGRREEGSWTPAPWWQWFYHQTCPSWFIWRAGCFQVPSMHSSIPCSWQLKFTKRLQWGQNPKSLSPKVQMISIHYINTLHLSYSQPSPASQEPLKAI